MPTIFFKSVPYDKNLVTLALESGVDGIIVPDEHVAEVSGLARCTVIPDSEVASVALNGKEDEEAFLARVQKGEKCVLKRGWQVIPVENLLAQSDHIYAEAGTPDEARLAAGILQRGVTGIVVLPEAAMELKTIVAECKLSLEHEDLVAATITRIVPAGLGNRVCCDTISLLHTGQGMLVGNSAAFKQNTTTTLPPAPSGSMRAPSMPTSGFPMTERAIWANLRRAIPCLSWTAKGKPS